MNYEQKYKEALARAKKLKETCDSTAVIGWCEHIFPELKESEDEKVIRDIKVVLECSATKFFKEEGKMPIWYDRAVAWLEKQSKQQPVYKIEPRLNIGDWVIVHNKDAYQVIEVNTYDYRLQHYLGGEMDYPFKYESDLKPWTIEDAKDGDVLCLGGVIAIFKKYIGQEKCICYCSFCDNGGFEIPIENGEDNVYGCTDTTPATKEQRDLLFAKMKEAGYEIKKN